MDEEVRENEEIETETGGEETPEEQPEEKQGPDLQGDIFQLLQDVAARLEAVQTVLNNLQNKGAPEASAPPDSEPTGGLY